MKNLSYTGLDAAKVQPVADALAVLLADFQVYYANLRNFHWNVQGSNFYALHAEFERLYDDAAEKADEIAERLLQLDVTPEHRPSKYLQVAQIKENEMVHCGQECLTQVLDMVKILIAQERAVMVAADEAGDESSNALMSDYLREQEKLVWMLTATLAKECSK